MIDYVDIRIHGTDLPSLGKELLTTHPSGAQSRSFTEAVARPGKHAPDFRAEVELKTKSIRFYGCPLRWLQGHNGLGSNDLRALVAAAVPLVFATLQQPCPRFVFDALQSGDYEVREVHVAELHRMRHDLIEPLSDHIRRHAPKELQAVPLEEGKGIGVRLWPHSRDRRVLLYDKAHYFHDKLIKHKRTVLGELPRNTFERFGISAAFDIMLDDYLRQGIRAETRLGRYLKRHSLDRGHAWKADTARRLHLDVLASIPLADLPFPAEYEALLLKEIPIHERRLTALWMTGRKMRNFFDSNSDYYRWRKLFLNKYGLDLSAAPLSMAGVRWHDLMAPSAIIDTPEWALSAGFVFDPASAADGDGKTHLEKAWLNYRAQA